MSAKRWWVIGGIALGSAAVLTPVYAFDHADAPETASDNVADIADVFAFMRPEPDGVGGYLPSTHLVLVMTIAPGAPTTFVPPPNIDYVFRVRSVSPTTLAPQTFPNFKVKCNFPAGGTPTVSCDVGGFPVARPLGPGDAGSPSDAVRVFAGPASDPAFADVAAFKATVDAGTNQFKSPGTNAFQGKNVLAIVVDLELTHVAFLDDAGGEATNHVLAVGGETIRN